MWKLFGVTGGTKEQMIEFFARIGLEPAAPLVNLVGTVEFVGGILIALGLLTRPAAALATVTTATAALYFHLPLGFYVEPGGVEFAGLWAVVLLMIAIRGGGRISLDRWLGREI
jgi:putative oxidoreductase